MGNIGTKAGTVMKPTQALKIAGTPDEVASFAAASSYLSYGSFSGVDCKVVVHYPVDHNMEKLVSEDKIRYEKELAEIDRQIDTFGLQANNPGGSITNQIIALTDSRDAALQQLELINGYLKDIKSFPTSKVLAELQTISYQSFRDKVPFRPLGSVYPVGYTRGPRTIAGSMIFTIFHQHVLHEILDLNLKFYNTGTSDHDKYRYTTNLADQLPPLDISLVFANEYGALSHMGIWGVEFISEGATFSIEDIFSENTLQWVARDLDPMRLIDKRAIDGQGIKEEWSIGASSLLQRKQYQNNHLTRRNQFI